ncbi:hypothetical protein N0Y54_25580 [Nostoc punctiforme UO1]|uniref:hypothetical protein n=1 Tax=Nostoc punctiforme TaxID=272131 RepID=UPI0030A5F4F6
MSFISIAAISFPDLPTLQTGDRLYATISNLIGFSLRCLRRVAILVGFWGKGKTFNLYPLTFSPNQMPS